MTTKQKGLLIDHLLGQDPKASSRSIAKKVGVDHKTIETRRRLTGGEIPHLTRKGTDGKTYTKPPQATKKPVLVATRTTQEMELLASLTTLFRKYTNLSIDQILAIAKDAIGDSKPLKNLWKKK